MEFLRGMLVESRAGHDKGSLYVVMEQDENFVYVCDGRIRTTDRLKRKKRKHLAKKGNIPELLAVKQTENKPFTNEDIKRVIKLWRSENV